MQRNKKAPSAVQNISNGPTNRRKHLLNFPELSGQQATASITDNTGSDKELQVKSENLRKSRKHYWIASDNHDTRALAFYASICAEHNRTENLHSLYTHFYYYNYLLSTILDFSYCDKHQDVQVLYRKHLISLIKA